MPRRDPPHEDAAWSGAFADLHCHPTLYAFNRLRHTPIDGASEGFDAWNVPASRPGPRSKGARATHYSQCDVRTLAENRVRLVFASLTPIERPFFVAEERLPFAGELARWASGRTPIDIGRAWATGDRRTATRAAMRILRNRGPLRKVLHQVFLGYSAARVRHLMSDRFDYWDELHREYAFLRDGADRDVPLGDGINGHYAMVADRETLDATLAADEDRLAMVLTIEGGHVLSLGPGDRRLPAAAIFERIDAIRRWPHPVLFLTLAHHFDNGLCGHARSLIDAGFMLLDQSRRMGQGFEPEDDLGMAVVRKLLGRNDHLDPTGEHPILIDAKHLSPRSRAEYYERIIRPLLRRADPVPVIFSHAGYSGVRSLNELIDGEDQECDRWVSAGFNAWGLNVSDEDVEMVHRTGGLIGICLDRRIAGVAPGHDLPREHHGRVVLRQIFGIVDAVMQDDRIPDDEAATIWDCITLGTDYDGAIHPLARYATAANLPDLAADLRDGLEAWRHTRAIERLGVDNLVDKVLWRNALEFAQRHLPTR